MKKLIVINVFLFVVFLSIYALNSYVGLYIFGSKDIALLADTANNLELAFKNIQIVFNIKSSLILISVDIFITKLIIYRINTVVGDGFLQVPKRC